MSLPTRIDGLLERASSWAVGLLAAGIIGLVSLADVATGAEVSSSVFYALPVAMVAWYARGILVEAIAVLAAGTWYAADRLAGATYSAPWIAVWNAGVRLAFFLIIARLLEDLRRALEAQRALAEVDPLTGLANGRRFLSALRLETARSARYRHSVSVAYIDLDGFKAVNDRFGHGVGDDVLEAVGRALGGIVRAADVPARLGGDEFAVLFPETDAPAVREAADKVRGTLERAMTEGGWPIGFSMGVVTSGGELADADELVRRADALMYEVKRSGKGRTSFGTAPKVEGDSPAS